MSRLTEQDFEGIKSTVQEGRLTMGGILTFLMGALFYMAAAIGYSLFAATANTVGWDTLSNTWHYIFYAEAVLFVIHILLILLAFLNSLLIHKILVVMVSLFSYKMVLDPFIAILMAAKDRGTYDIYLPAICQIIAIAFLIHFGLVIKKFYDIKKEKKDQKRTVKNATLKRAIPVILLLVVLTGIVIKSGILGENDLTFIIVISIVLLFAVLFGAVEFFVAAYCVIRFPSFVDPSPMKGKNQLNGRKKI